MSRASPPVRTPEKGTVIPKSATKTATQSLRIRPEELPEITHNCWRDWDEILMVLKEYFRRHFQDLESICPKIRELVVALCRCLNYSSMYTRTLNFTSEYFSVAFPSEYFMNVVDRQYGRTGQYG